MPFSLSELQGRNPISLSDLGLKSPKGIRAPEHGLMNTLFTGFYPRIHDKHLSPRNWLSNYYQTYIERDVRNVLDVGDLETFSRFVMLCAGRNGQLLNLSSLASDCGISHITAKRWISVLETSFIISILRPYYKNFGKRLVKSPKIYFLDTGLLCYLLRIQSPAEIHHHAARGQIFESFVVSELYKNFLNRNEQPGLFFWRDSNGREIDVLIELGSKITTLEIKSGQTIASDYFNTFKYWRSLKNCPPGPAALIYGGDQTYKREGVIVYPWHVL
jgi:hypothetical protein